MTFSAAPARSQAQSETAPARNYGWFMVVENPLNGRASFTYGPIRPGPRGGSSLAGLERAHEDTAGCCLSLAAFRSRSDSWGKWIVCMCIILGAFACERFLVTH